MVHCYDNQYYCTGDNNNTINNKNNNGTVTPVVNRCLGLIGKTFDRIIVVIPTSLSLKEKQIFHKYKSKLTKYFV